VYGLYEEHVRMPFWQSLPQPIIGLSPMDGVTDAAFRWIVAQHGNPDVQCTEFTHVEDLCRGIAAAWRQLRFVEIERPILAQLYGTDPDRFYQAAQVVCALGFDGVDINMGCPAKRVTAHGAGAALIMNPPLARAIIRAVHAGVRDWASGHALATLGLEPHVVEQLQALTSAASRPQRGPRTALPVSVKTRLGYDTVVIEDWVSTLLDEQPAAITIHGRTLTQMYRGQADWEAIRRAAELGRDTSTVILGNGDLGTMADVVARVRQTQVQGVLIGRGALGNPWIFRAKAWAQDHSARATALARPPDVSVHDRLQVALEHACYFERLGDGGHFPAMRKHLGWYCRDFPGAAETRAQMFKTTNATDVARVLATLQRAYDGPRGDHGDEAGKRGEASD
jgi:nifR3 family TIM-barrel protein